MVVSIVPVLPAGADPALKKLTPFTLSASPQELDEHFFSKITEPIAQTVSLIDSTTEYMKKMEEVKANTKSQSDKAENIKKKEKELKELMGENTLDLKVNATKIKTLINQIKEIDPDNKKAKTAQEELLKATTQDELFK
jgi:PRTRC genetic system protein E